MESQRVECDSATNLKGRNSAIGLWYGGHQMESEVRGRSWPSPGSPSAHWALGQQVSWGPGNRLEDVSCGAPVVFQSLSCVQLFATPWTAVCQAYQSITNSQSLLKLMFIGSVTPSTISSSVIHFSSCLQSFPASGSFLMSQFFASGGQSIGVSASASVLPVTIQD